LNFTTRAITIYSSILAIISIPIFYLIIHEIAIRKLDNELRHYRTLVEQTKQDIHSQEDLELYQRLHPEIELALTNSSRQIDTVFTELHYDIETRQVVSHREYRTSISVNNKRFELIIRQPMISTMEMIWAVVGTQCLFVIGLLTGAFLINRNLSKRIWKPFYKMLIALKDFKLGKSRGLSFEPSTISEFADLQLQLKELISENTKVYELQKKFTANAAHELQTPLAVFQSNLELLLQTKSLDEEQSIIIQNLLETTLRLSKLQKALLLLSRIEGKQFIETQKIDLVEICNEIISRFYKNIEAKSITVQTSYEYSEKIIANRELLETLLSNLLSNAIRYSKEKGEIKIIIQPDYLEIQNAGDKMTLEEGELFERFRKDKQTGNIGLGLAIAKQICETYSWRITYRYENGIHIFSIHFE
jgi:signal transduction histidine kinase